MTENRKTIWVGGIALALTAIAWATAPRLKTPTVLADRGQVMFPQFTDPSAAASLEIVEYDTKNGAAHPFKVQNRNGRWTIPSQHDYPADARDQLGKVAAAIIGLKKDDFVSDSATDEERCGVLDPLDATAPSLSGRGTRLTVRGSSDQVLADVILGNNVEGHPGFRYTRVPSQRRIYTSNVGNLKVSTDFSDWIERDLLEVNTEDIDAVNLRNYALDRATGRVDPGETMLIEKQPDDNWKMAGLDANEHLDYDALDALLRNISALRINGVLPKPAGIMSTLSQGSSDAKVSPDDRQDLARKGFYLAGNGQLVSDRGELVVRTNRGVYYDLRFGDIAPDSGGNTSGATTTAPEKGARENRYLFIMADFDPKAAATPGRASEGTQKVQFLRTRFAPWYYVIAADSFAKVHLNRKDLVKPGPRS